MVVEMTLVDLVVHRAGVLLVDVVDRSDDALAFTEQQRADTRRIFGALGRELEVQNETLDAIREWVNDGLFRLGAPGGKAKRFVQWHHSIDHSLHRPKT